MLHDFGRQSFSQSGGGVGSCGSVCQQDETQGAFWVEAEFRRPAGELGRVVQSAGREVVDEPNDALATVR